MPDIVIRQAVRGVYDMQKLRIQMGNRIAMSWLTKLGHEPGAKLSDLSDDDKKILDRLRLDYKKITDGFVEFPTKAQFSKRMATMSDSIISSYAELSLIRTYLDMSKKEEEGFKILKQFVDESPVWQKYLVDVKGCGVAMAAIILSEIDIHKAGSPSMLYKYAGLDVAEDGRGRSRRKEHLVEVEYTDKNGEVKTRNSITFNPFLKTKLLGVLAPCFIKAGGHYADKYREYKHRLETDPKHVEKTKGHRHNMAMRYCVKMFLLDLWLWWREFEGYEKKGSYHDDVLGHKHSAVA